MADHASITRKLSEAHAFVIDSGFDCNADKPLGDYLKDDTMETAGVCYDDKQYYLASAQGKRGKKFAAAPGIHALNETAFGGITKFDLVKGAIRTYLHNGGANNGSKPDPANEGQCLGNVSVSRMMNLPPSQILSATCSRSTSRL